MIINDTNKQMIREIIVELFKEVVEGNLQTNQEIQLEDCLQDIMSKKINNYEVNVYGVSLQEKL
tara:strand:- start:1928 stop:2119 length:192 start_codon:yes stop_codon:yes gene_type:complete